MNKNRVDASALMTVTDTDNEFLLNTYYMLGVFPPVYVL